MTKAKVDHAIRQALNNFDNWIDATGALPKFTTYYYECQKCIQDAVKIGIMTAMNISIEFDKGGELIDKKDIRG